MIALNDPRFLEAVDRGIREGVRQALLHHMHAGNSVCVWRDGKVVEIPPEEIPVHIDGAMALPRES